MKDFKIIEDLTLDYGYKDQLYLMFIRQGSRHYIVVDSRTVRIGSREVRSRREGDVVFSQMHQRMNKYTDIWKAFEVIDLAFMMDSIREHMFLVNNLNRKVEFNEIWKMKRMYDCETTPVITDLIFEDKTLQNTIYITFPGQTLPLGYFKAPDEHSKFIFHVSDEFKYRIP